MSLQDQTNTQEPNQSQQPEPQQPQPEKTARRKLADFPRRAYFGPEELQRPDGVPQDEKNPDRFANDYLAAIISSDGADGVKLISYNPPEGQEFPAGHTLGVFKVAESVSANDPKEPKKRVQVTRQIVAWPMPTVQLLSNSANGMAFVADAVNAALADQIARPLRSADPAQIESGEITSMLPVSIEDFTEGGGREGLLKPFTELAPDFIKALAKNYGDEFKRMFPTPKVLRDALSNKALAQSMYPSLEEKGFFVKALDSLSKKSVAFGFNPAIFAQWKAERDNASFEVDVDAMDFDNL